MSYWTGGKMYCKKCRKKLTEFNYKNKTVVRSIKTKSIIKTLCDYCASFGSSEGWRRQAEQYYARKYGGQNG